MLRLLGISLLCLSWVTSATSAERLSGYHASISVQLPTRLDWVFALANQSPASPPEGWLKDYDSTKQTYELFVPKNYSDAKAWPVVIFISPSSKAMGFRSWRTVCEQPGVIFAGAHNAGNGCDTPKRVRIVLDVLDDVRRRFHTDVDRTYISGFSGGGRIACAIGFSLPEHFGGVVPICAAGDLREESWLRQRVIDRLSVANLTGERDFNQGEVERFRGPMLKAVGVRSRVWVFPRLGHSMPSGENLVEVFRWLDEQADSRRSLARKDPTVRIPGNESPSRGERARQLLTAAKRRLSDPKTLYSGLMLAKGVYTRWPDLPEAGEAKKLLLKYEDDRESRWQEQDIAEQRKFLVARARALSDYASGPLPKQYAKQRSDMAKAAINLWEQLIADGQDKAAVADGRRRISDLKKIVSNARD